MHARRSPQHLTFDALLQPLAAPLVGAPPLPLLRGLVLRLLTVFALGRGREERQRGSSRTGPACHPPRRAAAEEGAPLLCVCVWGGLGHPGRALTDPATPRGPPTSLPECGHQVVGMSSCRPASSTRSGLLM